MCSYIVGYGMHLTDTVKPLISVKQKEKLLHFPDRDDTPSPPLKQD